MAYISGYVAAVPNANKEKYLDLARKVAAYFKKHGASRVVEGWGDSVPDGVLTSFTIATQRKDDETCIFSWTEWPSKEACDAGMSKAMEEFGRESGIGPGDVPFDGKRMFWGGFQVILDA